MKVVNPIKVTDGMLLSHNVLENDHPVWSAATNYAIGDRVIRTQTHRIYEAAIAGVNATAPELAPARWQDVGPTNRWAAFDRSVGTKTTRTGQITMLLVPDVRFDHLVLLDLFATKVNVLVYVPSTNLTLYSRTIELAQSINPITNYLDYWLAEFTFKRAAIFNDLPDYIPGGSVVVINIFGSSTSVGVIGLGKAFDIGRTQRGMGLGIRDYSIKEPNSFGAIDVVERDYSKKARVPVLVPNTSVDRVCEVLAELRATPVIWIATEQFDASVLYGFLRDWEISITYVNDSVLNLNIEGLT